ncbi:MAG: phosphoribosylformylglycinamidine cyclo-ligase [Oscillospiraceae bacterium]|nr:phosphoribosylformylglycinamidine cyclo-ligase [Oscillospiraceae bacterium]
MNSFSETYKSAGVDITAGYKSVELMKKHIGKTLTKGVISGIGGFGGLFEPDLEGFKRPVFVSGTDGVGTKLKLAFMLDKHDTIGIDCVAMCVNDIICCGARPLFFLDYLAMGKNVPERTEMIVGGVADGCVQAGAALIGGETAEMPGFYPENEYDLAGFSVGIVDREKIIDGSNAKEGDAIIALASSGPHSNGFSLIRKILNDTDTDITEYSGELGCTIGESLLTPTKIYVKSVLKLLETVAVNGISNITGGGFYENIPRSVPAGLSAKIYEKNIKTPPVFAFLQKLGNIPKRDMFNTFNMGVGMSLTVRRDDAGKAIEILRQNGEDAYVIGEIANGENPLELCRADY